MGPYVHSVNLRDRCLYTGSLISLWIMCLKIWRETRLIPEKRCIWGRYRLTQAYTNHLQTMSCFLHCILCCIQTPDWLKAGNITTCCISSSRSRTNFRPDQLPWLGHSSSSQLGLSRTLTGAARRRPPLCLLWHCHYQQLYYRLDTRHCYITPHC